MCRLTCVASVLIFSAVALAEQDDLSLLQAQAAVKTRSPETPATSEHAPACVADEAPLDFSEPVDFSLVSKPEPFDVPAVREPPAQAHVKSPKAAPNPTLVILVRQVLWLLSLVVAANGVMRLRGHKAPVNEDGPVIAKHEAKATDEPATAAKELQNAALAGDDARCAELLDEAGVLYGGGPCEALLAMDAWGTTALHAAAIGGAHVVAELLLEHGTPVDTVNVWDETPLHLAARWGHVELCQLLLKSGASLHAVNVRDETPLVIAGQAGHGAVCRALLALGASVEGLPREEMPALLQEIVAEAMPSNPN